MKKKDLLLIVVIVFISGVVSIVISNAVIGTPKSRSLSAEVVEPITDEFPEADDRYFNAQSIDPTQLIEIKDNSDPAAQQPNGQ